MDAVSEQCQCTIGTDVYCSGLVYCLLYTSGHGSFIHEFSVCFYATHSAHCLLHLTSYHIVGLHCIFLLMWPTAFLT